MDDGNRHGVPPPRRRGRKKPNLNRRQSHVSKKPSSRKQDRRHSAIATDSIAEYMRRAKEQIIGPYLVMKKIGKGAMGTVFMATNKNDGRTHAIKRVSMHRVPEEHREGIESEIKMLKYLSHPNIVKYIDTIREEKFLNIVLEYVPNGALSTMLSKFGKFSETLSCHYIFQVLGALAYLHEQGIIHRDIKGANILADSDGVVKLTDFGVATNFKHGGADDENLPAGTMNFMAPEVITMTSPPTYACDVWSVGATVIELLTGNPPYSDEDGMSACYRIVNDDHPPLPSSMSSACKNFLLECFQKDPDLRISAKDLQKHDWLELHRKNADEKKSEKYPENKEKLELSVSLGGDASMGTASPNIRVYKTVHSSMSTGLRPDLQKFAETEDDFDYDDLEIDTEIPADEASRFNDQIMALDLHFEEKADAFAMEVVDELRYKFEDIFKNLEPSSKRISDPMETIKILEQLQDLTINNPDRVGNLVLDIFLPAGTGMMILMDLLSANKMLNLEVAQSVIKWINLLLKDDMGKKFGKRGAGSSKFQQRLCNMGLVNVILKFCHKRYPIDLRIQAAEFAKTLSKSNSYTRKMLCACGGLRVLVELFDKQEGGDTSIRRISHPIIPSSVTIDEKVMDSLIHMMGVSKREKIRERKKDVNKESSKGVDNTLTLVAIDCVEEVFKIVENPKDDFCRLLCEYGILPKLTESFAKLKKNENKEYVEKIVELISVFSGADKIVRRRMSTQQVVQPIIPELSTLNDVHLEKMIKSLKMICGLKDPGALEELEKAGIISAFVSLLNHSRRDICNQLILCLDMLLDISPRRMEQAVKIGLVEDLLRILSKDNTMMQIIKKILCALPMSSASVREKLSKNHMLSHYLSWFTEPAWRINALTSVSLWLKEDPEIFGRLVTLNEAVEGILRVSMGKNISPRQLGRALPIIHSMIECSPTLCTSLARSLKLVNSLLNLIEKPVIHDDPVDIRIHIASTQILDALTTCESNTLDVATMRRALSAFTKVSEDAKQMRKVRLWSLADRCHQKLKFFMSKNVEIDESKSRQIHSEEKDNDFLSSMIGAVGLPRGCARAIQSNCISCIIHSLRYHFDD